MSSPKATYSLNKCAQTDEMGKMNKRNSLTTKDVAERMGVSVSTVYRFIRNGGLQAKRIRGVYRINIGDYERFMFNRWWQKGQVQWF